MDHDRAKHALAQASRALESLSFSAPESRHLHQARLALALHDVAEACELTHGQGKAVPILIDAANVLQSLQYGALAGALLDIARREGER